MTSGNIVADLIELDCKFDHVVFDPVNHRENGYIFKKVKFKAILSFVL